MVRDQSASSFDERFHLSRYWNAETTIRRGIKTLMRKHEREWTDLDVDIDQE